ncbi:PIN domain-containing protein [Haloferula sp. BvORR071]|uniref:PIN domain-containing protein n=1 Tax=Haloferula sp. BvORR071 TaxID=1396141 RepID=UPI0006961F72|nr:PIN domain-containing protein [Haloferula sp. BvORR071]
MKHLLDVNLLVAWGWSDHSEHQRTARWLGEMKGRRGVKLCTTPIVELGFIRVSVQRSGGRVALADAAKMLGGMLAALGTRHEFIPDDLSPTGPWPKWCVGPSQSTDAHLLALAVHHGGVLATLDTGIPGAVVVGMA